MEYMNVRESWALYDSLVICKQLYGKEPSVPGWFTNFTDFSSNESHIFFKGRTEGNSHPAYCNLKSADNVDFVFTAYSFGVRFCAPVAPDTVMAEDQVDRRVQECLRAYWMFDLPRHCGIELQVQQDIKIQAPCMIASPGYGPRGGGGSQPVTGQGGEEPNASLIFGEPWQMITGSQGEPVIDCRFILPSPISIARNTPVEATLKVSPLARTVLSDVFNSEWLIAEDIVDADTDYLSYTGIPSRWVIQASLFGTREVQQRGQYHAPGAI